MNAKLPINLEQETIEDMLIGEECWVAPWAMYADTDSSLWLNSGYSIHNKQFGTVNMKIKRVEDGYLVDVSKCADYGWKPARPGYATPFTPLPVIQLVNL